MNSTHHPAFWPYDYRDRVVRGWKGLLVGVLVADVVFFLVPGVMKASQDPQHAAYQLSFLPILMVFGVLPIGLVGLPTAMLLGKILRGIRNQWIHVAAFIVAGALVGTLVGVPLLSSQSPEWAVVFFLYSLLPVWAIGAAVGFLLGLALRRLRNQWLHVAAFFAGGLLMCAPFGGLSATGPLLFSSSIALAAGIGRLAAWKLVRINDAGVLSK